MVNVLIINTAISHGIDEIYHTTLVGASAKQFLNQNKSVQHVTQTSTNVLPDAQPLLLSQKSFLVYETGQNNSSLTQQSTIDS